MLSVLELILHPHSRRPRHPDKMPKSIPLVGLLTDFGLRDHYVAVMKAIMAGIDPSIRIIDISHDVIPGDVKGGSCLLWASYAYFPKGTVFAAIVDPGVGTSRDIIIVRTASHTFVAPNNGLLDLVMWEERIRAVTVFEPGSLGARRILPKNISSTFHGRDIFAPLAVFLAGGGIPTGLGAKVKTPPIASPFVIGARSTTPPAIFHIDRFGNIITNLRMHGEPKKEIRGLRIGTRVIDRWVRTFADASPTSPSLLIGSSGLVEIVCKSASAAEMLRARTSTKLRLVVD